MRRVLPIALYALFVLPFSLHAQDLPVFRSDSTVVVVPVTVTDRSGRSVSGLTAADFGARRVSAHRASSMARAFGSVTMLPLIYGG